MIFKTAFSPPGLISPQRKADFAMKQMSISQGKTE
jgi:hypothetical protein